MDPENSVEKESLTARTAHGFAWMVGQSLLAKLVRSAGHVVLAWLLLPGDWGLIAMTYTIVAFGEQVRSLGMRQVLIHRQGSYRRWANAAFWMSGAMGLVTAVLMIAAAPLVARLYEQPALVGLITVLALATPARAFATVPEARLQIDMRFGFLAGATFVQTVGILLLTILLAALDFGAYSFVWPQLVVYSIRTVVFLRVAPPPLSRNVQLRRWRYLLGDSMRVFAANVLFMVAVMAAPIILGLYHAKDVVGLYYFSVNLSAQTIRQITLNLATVLFPALAILRDEPQRQMNAFLRASRVLAVVAVPLCLLQAALVDPFVHVFLSDRWLPTIALMQALSLGAAVRVISQPSLSLMQAQGRFATYLVMTAVLAVAMMTGVWLAGSRAGVFAVAVTVAVTYTVMTPIQCYVAIRPVGGGWLDVLRVYSVPLGIGALAVGGGTLLGRLLPDTTSGYVLEAVVILVTFVVVYLPIVRRTCPDETAELARRLGKYIPGHRRRAAANAPA